jgi:linoleoyl-CoA desaturase
MANHSFQAVKFIGKEKDGFGATVKKRVAEYFKANNKERTGDYRIWIKVIVLPLMYLVPFAFLFTPWASNHLLLFYGLWILMGTGIAGCGLGIMHDACHGALSKNKTANRIVGMVLNLAGGHVLNWQIQHNVLHHSYTNIDGYDEDIDPSGVMRFSPHQPVKWFYKYQIYYAWFLYGLMTFSWATWKDFQQLARYDEKGLLDAQGTTYKKELLKTIGNKIIYYSIFIIAPLYFIDVAWYHILIGWFSMHFVAGLILACIFQPAHVVPTSEFPLPDKNHTIDGDRDVYQLLTTSNFAPTNRILSWYVGGLNYQIEHHLFPTMSHVHHRAISPIVKKTAEEFGLPYNSEPTFFGALKNHAKMLYKFRK